MESLETALRLATACSPFLTHLLKIYPSLPREMAERGAHALFAEYMQHLPQEAQAQGDMKGLMRCLRIAKGKVALLTALADLRVEWNLGEVTANLTQFADTALQLALDHLLLAAEKRGEITRVAENGLIILGMGKMGAHELNYSSDIDLIIFYERDRLNYKGRHTEQHFMNKLAQDLVHVMQERTAEGYVFRTDLRLRPDPASTPPAINTEAGHYYYESVGQNWERAAMIKARAVAGDMEAAARFMQRLTPFMWRRSMDFAALQDIHSIKRQMDSRGDRSIKVAGHNVKLGQGGIREIEFFVQIHQLIWGGRKPGLRTRGTCETLELLAREGLIAEEMRATLEAAYVFLRTLEHRLQMVADQQTHDMPKTEEALANIALFMGHEDADVFAEAMLSHLHAVHEIFSASFRSADALANDGGNLVFTGVTHDPETLATLSGMGFKRPEAISETIMGWHHGSRRATRTKRARELLTELVPVMLKAFSDTADPDAAFLNFDQFVGGLPAGVQIFSLFTHNPSLLNLIASVFGSAPVLAKGLSKHPPLLESVLAGDFYSALPTREALEQELRDTLSYLPHFEDQMEGLRRFRQERQFQAGVQLLKNMLGAGEAGAFLSTLAEVALQETLRITTLHFEESHGRMPGGRFCVLALGKLGSREMTFDSDLDLVFVYDAGEDAFSDGEKSHAPGVYYNRLTQRLHSALTTLGREGRLYEVDTRLRPSGAQGLSAVSVGAFERYFSGSAWTFEFMALTRARAVAGDETLCEEMGQRIHHFLSLPRDAEALRRDVAHMRERVAQEFPKPSPWHIKHARGGLMDIDFIAQYLYLKEAATLPPARAHSSEEIFRLLHAHGRISAQAVSALLTCNRILLQLQSIIRLVAPGEFNPKGVGPGLARLLAHAAGAPDFSSAENLLAAIETHAYGYYVLMVEKP